MKRLLILLPLMILLASGGVKTTEVSPIGKTVNDFCLLNTDGKQVSLSDYKTAKGFVVVFICNHCPFAKLYTDRLNALNTKYKPLGVPVLTINSMDTLTYESERWELMRSRAQSEHYNFPYLQDAAQTVGQNFGANRTPHAYVLWRVSNKWIIKYSGAIDDNGKDASAAQPFIANALDDLLAGKPVANPETLTVGCAIHYRLNQ